MATIIGTNGNDNLIGTADGDLIQGLAGNDRLRGEGGNDTLEGGAGNDQIRGGDGDDSADGGAGNDRIDGEAGNDTILGGAGNDNLRGGDGDDYIEAGTGNDQVRGGDGNDTIQGGGDNDNLRGGDDEDLFILSDSGTGIQNTNVDGGGGGSDFDTLDFGALIPPGGSYQNVMNPSGNGFNGQIRVFDASGNVVANVNYSDIEAFVPCFTPGTRIATQKGEVAVETLAVGDRIITRDSGIQTLRWVGQRRIGFEGFDVAPHLRPVLIKAGALGRGLPERDMLVSPQHRFLVVEDKAQLFWDEREVLVAAKHLTVLPGVWVATPAAPLTYIHLLFDNHEVILSDGTWSESFQPGARTLAGLEARQRAELLELFPALGEMAAQGDAFPVARRQLKRHEVAAILG